MSTSRTRGTSSSTTCGGCATSSRRSGRGASCTSAAPACALARALAAERPEDRQEVIELDPAVVEMRAAHLGLRRAPGLRVRVGDGRAVLAGRAGRIGRRGPGRRVRRRAGAASPRDGEALADLARVAGLVAVNVVDTRAMRGATAIAAGLGEAFGRAGARRRAGAGQAPRRQRRARGRARAAAARPAARAAAADRSPARGARAGGHGRVHRRHAAVARLKRPTSDYARKQIFYVTSVGRTTWFTPGALGHRRRTAIRAIPSRPRIALGDAADAEAALSGRPIRLADPGAPRRSSGRPNRTLTARRRDAWPSHLTHTPPPHNPLPLVAGRGSQGGAALLTRETPRRTSACSIWSRLLS